MTTRSTRTPRRSSAAAKRSWVSGRSAARPCRRIAMALASHAPIQMGRYRSPSGSLRITTWRVESMWTRTLSMTISTRPVMTGLSHRPRRRLPSRRTRAHDPQQDPDHDAQHGAADVREERDAAARRAAAERADAAHQLEHEPEAQEDDRRDLEQLVEEAEEHQGQDARAREKHDVHAERCRDRTGRADQRRGRLRVDDHLGQRRCDAADEVEDEERDPAKAILDVVAEDPQVQHVAEDVQPATVQEHAGDHPERRPAEVVAGLEGGRDPRRDRAPLVEEALEGG